jgi:hypothetical protein
VQVTLRGKKYDVSDVTTVQELQERLGDASGVDPSKQGRVLFDGQRLSPSDSLTDKGVQEGAQLNIVPASSKKKKSSSSTTSTSTSSSSTSSSTSSAKAAGSTVAAAATASSGNPNPMKEMLEMAGIDSSQLDDLVKSMGGGGENGGEAPSMQESMQMMSSMMNSPIFQEYMNDPAKLEESRQMILNNPMLKSMMAGMPGMDQLLNDKEAWAMTMQAAAGMYSNMDPNDLMQAMGMAGMDGSQAGGMGGMAGMGMGGGGVPPGLFDGMDMNMNAALDELSEGEDE